MSGLGLIVDIGHSDVSATADSRL